MFCFYAPEEAQFEFGSGGDTSPELNRESYLYSVNVAIQEGRRKAGLVVDLDRQLPPLLAAAGLRVVADDKGTIPVGKLVGEMLGGGGDARAREGGKGEEGEKLDVPRHVPYSVKSVGPPTPSALKTGACTPPPPTRSLPTPSAPPRSPPTPTSTPHPLSPPLSPTDLRTIEGATSKMFGHFVGMMREAWEGDCLRDYDGQVVGKGAEGEKRLGEIEARVWKEF
ncbi:hypothetical protein GGF50DRAFT_120896 [Schizophyllum commune]